MHRREGKGLRASSGVMVALLAAMALLPFSHIPSVSVDNSEDIPTGSGGAGGCATRGGREPRQRIRTKEIVALPPSSSVTVSVRVYVPAAT